MTRKIDARLVSALLVGLLAFFTSWSAFAGANHRRLPRAVHARYYLYEPPSSFIPFRLSLTQRRARGVLLAQRWLR